MKDRKMLAAEKNILSDMESMSIRGGEKPVKTCYCACYYRNVGGSSIQDNKNANFRSGLSSPQFNVRGSVYVVEMDDGSIHTWGEN